MRKCFMLIVIFLFGLNYCSGNEDEIAKFNDSAKDYNISNEMLQFQKFWKEFRSATMEKDYYKLIKLVKFPLNSRGPFDYNPIIKLNKNEFLTVFENYLSEPIFLKDMEYITTLNYITTKNSIASEYSYYQKYGILEIENMGFSIIDSKWKLTFLYVSYEGYKRIGYDIE